MHTHGRHLQRKEQAVNAVLVVAIMVGLGLRFLALFASPFLENDEAALAENIESRDFAGLTGALEFGQAAPMGFLWLAKLSWLALGSSPPSFRALPFVFSVLSLPLAYAVAQQAFRNKLHSVAATSLFATSPALVHYAGFFKQYSCDIVATLLILYVFQPFLTNGAKNKLTARASVWMVSIGVALPWISHASVFVMTACLAVLGSYLVWERRWRELLLLVVAAVPWTLSFGIHYWLFARNFAQSAFLKEFWAAQLLPEPATASAVLKWAPKIALEWVAYTFGIRLDSAAGLLLTSSVSALLLYGIVSLLVTNRWIGIAWTLTIGFTAMAAILRVYPFAGRLVLFISPLALFATAHGLVNALSRVRPSVALAAPVLAAAAMAVAAFRTPLQDEAAHPFRLAQACRYVADAAKREAAHIYIFYPNRAACHYHILHSGIDLQQVTVGEGDSQTAFGATSHIVHQVSNLPVKRWRDLWVVFSHERMKDGRDERAVVTNLLEQRCELAGTRNFGEVRIDRYDCR